MSTAITPTSSAATSPSIGDASTRIPIQTLSQQDFLKLLTTQMSAQDPLNPQTDTQFIAQMAQFSALEESKTMQADIAKLRTDQEMTQASALIGKSVDLQVSQDLTTQGTVSAVQIQAGTPQLIVNGQTYDLSQVITISPAVSAN